MPRQLFICVSPVGPPSSYWLSPSTSKPHCYCLLALLNPLLLLLLLLLPADDGIRCGVFTRCWWGCVRTRQVWPSAVSLRALHAPPPVLCVPLCTSGVTHDASSAAAVVKVIPPQVILLSKP